MENRGRTVTAVFGESRQVRTAALWQWDCGQRLKVTGLQLPAAWEAHISNTGRGDAMRVAVTGDTVAIDDAYLQSGQPVYVYIWLHETEQDSETEYVVTIPVNRRPKPKNVTPTPAQDDAIATAIAALNGAVEQTGADVISTGAAKTAAEAAQGAAEAAQGAAERAADAAAGSARGAAGAAETATGAAEAAQRDAAAAAGSAEAAAASAEAADDSADDAADSARDAAASAEDADGSARAAAGSASAASGSATAAGTAKTKAETAQGKAEDAQDKAETAQSKAETAQGKAETAQGKAETAQGAASGSATAASGSADAAAASALTAEAWATGKKNGQDVPSTAPQYNNNAEYYKDQCEELVGDLALEETQQAILDEAEDANTLLRQIVDNPLETLAHTSERYAKGTEDGVAVESGVGYHDNSKYYKEQTEALATEVQQMTGTLAQETTLLAVKSEAEQATELLEDMVEAGTKYGQPSAATDGVYILQATVSNGAITYAWVAAS